MSDRAAGTPPPREPAQAELGRARARIAELENALAEAKREAISARELLEHEIELRNERIRTLSDTARERQRELTLTQRRLDAILSRRSVRLATEASHRLRAVIRPLRERLRSTAHATRHTAPLVAILGVPSGYHRLRASAGAQRALARRLLADMPPGSLETGPLVSIIILTRDGLSHLKTLMPALGRLRYRDVEVIVVDNGSTDGTAAYLARLRLAYPLRVVHNDENRTFAEANTQGVGAAAGSLLLLLNNDIEPVGRDFLGRMVQTIESAGDIAAVGARLVYPRRRGPRLGRSTEAPDLTLQHRGTHFLTGDGVPLARNIGHGEDPTSPPARAVADVPAVTAACMLVRRSAWAAVGGMSSAYDYGQEDVELCLNLRARGWRIIYDGTAVLWHNESATQRRDRAEARRERQLRNRRTFVGRWGVRLFREVLSDRLRGGTAWTADPIQVGITLAGDDPGRPSGDRLAAHDLGAAFERMGWRVCYLERRGDRWYRPSGGLDIVVSLLGEFDLRQVPSPVVTIAWCRDSIDHWLDQPWFNDYDIVLAGSTLAKEWIESRSSARVYVVPLATNPARFHPADPDPAVAVDAALVGDDIGEDLDIGLALPLVAAAGHAVGAWGSGWTERPQLAGIAREELPCERVPAVYASAGVVIDDAVGGTRPWGVVNSRVFDALSAGAVAVTSNAEGVRELFDEEFPTWHDGQSLAAVVNGLLADPERRRVLADRYRTTVLDRHTYDRRAGQIRDIALDWVEARRVAVCIGPPDWDVAPSWGDTHFARGLQRQFARLGWPTTVRILPEWDLAVTARADVLVHLFGLRPHEPRPGQVNLLWIISHPDLVTDELIAGNDAVLVASDAFAEELASRTTVPVFALHQATDPERFRPDAVGPRHDLLFVANSRGVRRKIIDDLTPTTHDLAVYGLNWTSDLLDPRYHRGDHVPNELLPGYYASARIVLNDHWDDMRRHGFLSNRPYDALAAGAFVISDFVPGIDEEFDDSVATYQTSAELRELIDRYLIDERGRRERVEQGRAAVLARHTFALRAASIIEIAEPYLAGRPDRVSPSSA